MENDRKIAVLIDADNVSQKYIQYILDEIVNHGIPTYKRIYGDWTKPQLASWKEVLLEYSISPCLLYTSTIELVSYCVWFSPLFVTESRNRTGSNNNPVHTSPHETETCYATSPTRGPPMICPKEFNCPLVENMVARILSSMYSSRHPKQGLLICT